jgi:hypothetical protein
MENILEDKHIFVKKPLKDNYFMSFYVHIKVFIILFVFVFKIFLKNN